MCGIDKVSYTMDLCVHCDSVLQNLASEDILTGPWEFSNYMKVSELATSASSCRLCELVLSSPAVLDGTSQQSPVDRQNVKRLLSRYPPECSDRGVVQFVFEKSVFNKRISSLVVLVPVVLESGPDRLVLRLAVWADQGTSTSFVFQPVLKNTQDLLLTYLVTCVPKRQYKRTTHLSLFSESDQDSTIAFRTMTNVSAVYPARPSTSTVS